MVYGVPHPIAPTTLAPGVSILPLPSPLDVFDLAALGAKGFREWAALEPILRGCTCEIESALDSSVAPGLDTLNRAWLAVALLVIRGFTASKGVAVSKYRWQDVPDPEHSASWEGPVKPEKRRTRNDLKQFQGGLLDLHFQMLTVGEQPRELDSDTLQWIADVFPVANRLSVPGTPFLLALQAATDWRFTSDKRTAIARLWSGIESIFSINAELVYRLSLLSASLLEPRGQDRLSRFNQVKKLYSLRSKAVHGEKMSDEKLSEALNGSFALLTNLLFIILEKGEMLNKDDFDKALFF